MFAAQPAEYESCDQGTSTGGQADRDTSQVNGKCADQTTEQNTQSHKDHICLVGGAIDIAHLFGGSFYFEFCSGQFEDIAGVDHCLSEYRHIDACPLDAADADTVHEFQRTDRGDLFTCECAVGDHYRKRLCREVEQLGVDHFRTDPVFFADCIFTAAA